MILGIETLCLNTVMFSALYCIALYTFTRLVLTEANSKACDAVFASHHVNHAVSRSLFT